MHLKNLLKKKSVIAAVLVILIGGAGFGYAAKQRGEVNGLVTEVVARETLEQTVQASGQVESGTDLSLSFKGSGVVNRVNVKVGDKVAAGQILAVLDQKNELASLTSARASLATAQANYQKLLDGAGSEEIDLARKAVAAAEVTLANAQKTSQDTISQQQVLVDNAYRALLNSTLAAAASFGNQNTKNPIITGTYNSKEAGSYTIWQEGNRFFVTGLENSGDHIITTSYQVPLGTRGLSIQFPEGYTTYGRDSWTVSLPNSKADNYLANYNAYKAAMETQRGQITSGQAAVAAAKAALEREQAALVLKQAATRPAELAGGRAQILGAEGQVQTALAALENTILRAPSSGTITDVDIKLGELAVAQSEVVVLQDIDNLHVEANVSEANIAGLKPGQSVAVTFDALGTDRIFAGVLQKIDPAATMVSGVVNYKVIVGVQKTTEIKPGMTANLVIVAEQRPDALSLPARLIINRDGKHYVRVAEGSAAEKVFREREVEIGLTFDGGLVEILSGLTEGQEVAGETN